MDMKISPADPKNHDMRHFIIDENKKLIPVDFMTWARWFETADKVIKKDYVTVSVAGPTVEVSTVFLGLNHQFGDGPPLLFETMIFCGPEDGYQDRYSTYEEALAGHEKALQLAKKNQL